MHPPPFPPLPSEVETLPGLNQGERIGVLVREVARLRRERDEARRELASVSSLPSPRGRLPGWLAAAGSVGVLFLPALGAGLAKRWPDLAVPIDEAIKLAVKLAHWAGL